ncbi:MAG: CopD family protein [Beijerinckiaceae bacterium]|jgi:putative copper export protein|nr:CopD family protein [Beijerinckiaceae bacterium]
MEPLYLVVLLAHVLGATVWTGGHLILSAVILPGALAARDPAILLGFEQRYERIGMPALLVQVLTGVWLSGHLLGWDVAALFDTTSPVARAVLAKLALLALTAGLALNARFRVLPNLTAQTLPVMAAHVFAVTALSILFVAVGLLAGRGGL